MLRSKRVKRRGVNVQSLMACKDWSASKVDWCLWLCKLVREVNFQYSGNAEG